ncbi:hypothetical protein [Candidatus Regiella insecticola]
MCISPEDETAYRYMCRKMAARGLSCGDKPPVWGCHSCGGYQQAPDAEVARMLLSDHQLTACQMIMLSLECPADQLLASDYNAWCELVYSPLAETDYAEVGLPVPSEREKDHQLFAINYTPDALIQATLPSISRDWLTRAQPLVLDSNHEVCILEESYLAGMVRYAQD